MSIKAKLPTTPPLRLDQLVERLQTEEGKQLLTALHDEVAPHISTEPHEGHMTPLTSPPARDRFVRGVVDAVHDQWDSSFATRRTLPQALARLFADHVDDQGVVNVAGMQKALGPRALQLVTQLANIKEPRPADPLADRKAYALMGDAFSAQVLGHAESLAPSMRALDYMKEHVAQPGELKDLKFMGLQHLFASSLSLFNAIGDLGVQGPDMRFVGKIYSTNRRVMAELEGRGAKVASESFRFTEGSFTKAMDVAIRHQLGALVQSLGPPERLPQPPRPLALLIDDGAEAIKILHEDPELRKFAPYFACVEQTRRGARILHELADAGKLLCPVVNVAESWAKLEWESPMIGHSVVLEVNRKLDRLVEQGVRIEKKATVLGAGSVGGAVARSLLERGYQVHVYDPDGGKIEALRKQLQEDLGPAAAAKLLKRLVPETNRLTALQSAHLLVSCVGKRTLEPEDHVYLPDGAILVNAASADDELGPEQLMAHRKGQIVRDPEGHIWNTFRGKPIDLGLGEAAAHSDMVVKNPDTGHEFLLVNQGYVVNMTGERDPIPPEYIQLTRTLLFLGAIAAKRADAPGIHEVPQEWQTALVHLVQRELRGSGGDLKQPRWHLEQSPPKPMQKEPPLAILDLAFRESKNMAPAVDPEFEKLRATALAEVSDDQLNEVRARLVAANEKKKADPDVVHGYRIGPVEPGSLEEAVARVVEAKRSTSPRALSVEGAALHRAVVNINAHFQTHFVASLDAGSSLFDDPFRLQFHEPHAVDTGGSEFTQTQKFEAFYGHMSHLLVGSMLQSRLRRPPRVDEVAPKLAELLMTSKVPKSTWLEALERSAQPGERDLAARLRALGVG